MKLDADTQKWKMTKLRRKTAMKIHLLRQKAALESERINFKLDRKVAKLKAKSARKMAKLERLERRAQLKKRAEMRGKNAKSGKWPEDGTGDGAQLSENAEKKERLTKISVPNYSLAEELINSISHGVAAVLAIIALVLCVVKAQTPIAIVSAAIYGTFVVVLYVISCIYHALSSRVLGKKVLRVLDHINVMLMVAGTYTPICLSLLGGTLGWVIFAIVWAITITAVVFNAINVDKYQYISVACNLILGWGALLIMPQLVAACPLWGVLAFLVGGGAVYSLGSILYVVGAKKKYMHSVFHFFVIFASVLHFFFVYLFCL